MSVQKILRAVFYALVAIISVIGFYQIFFSENVETGTSVLLNLTIVLIAVIVLFAFVASPIVGIVQNPKGIVKSLIGAGALLVIFLIGYSIADDGVTRTYESMGVTTAAQSKLVGGVIYTVFSLIVIGVLAYIYSSINSVLKQL